MNYSTWKEARIPTADLLLDQLNPRIPTKGKKLSQEELIVDLVENDKVYELAEIIANNGYLPDQYLIVCKEDGKYVVVEGNRRLASCKLLLKPSLSPSAFSRRFTTLSSKIDPAEIAELKVFIAPSREEAIPLIVSRHTETTIEAWGPIMQANFYARQIQGGTTIEKLSKTLGVSVSSIKDALFTSELYSEIQKLKLPADIVDTVGDPRAFKITTLTRLAQRPLGRIFFGVKQDARGKLSFSLPKADLKKKLMRVVTDIAKGERNSRNLNKDDQIKDYFAEIEGKKAVKRVPTAKQATSPEVVPSVHKPKIPKALIEPEAICEVESARIREIFSELQRLPVGDFPNATSVLLRVLLEQSTEKYLDDIQEIDPWKRELAASGQLNIGTFPSLTPMLKRIITKKLLDHKLHASLNTFLGKEDPLVDELNLYVHNSTYTPTEADLRGHWKKLADIVKFFTKKRP